MCTIDWTRYVGAQMKWAEILLTRADEIPGYEARVLRAKGAEILADVRPPIQFCLIALL